MPGASPSDSARALGLIARGLAIGRERRAWRCHPGRDRQRLSKCGRAERAGKNPAPEEDSAAEEPAGCTAILGAGRRVTPSDHSLAPDRKSTRLNSSHLGSSYAVFCLKKTHT